VCGPKADKLIPKLLLPGGAELSHRDSLRVLDLLENPPKPNAKLVSAAKALPKRR